jgi:hypothetical protein
MPVPRLLPPASLFLVLVAGCYIDERSLHGEWQAAAFYENSQLLQVPLDSVSLHFTDDGLYHFSSLGYYREDGYFRTSMHYLLLTDTSTTPSQDHILKILDLSADTLTLRMERGGNEQMLVLARKK